MEESKDACIKHPHHYLSSSCIASITLLLSTREQILLAFFTGFILAHTIRLAKNHNIPIKSHCTALFHIFLAFCGLNFLNDWGCPTIGIALFIILGAWVGDMPGWLLCAPVVPAK